MCSPQPALSVRLSPCLPLSLPAPAQSARIIPIYLLPWLYITIYHLSSLCCPPPRYLHCLSPWHASLSPFSLRCHLILLCISLEIFFFSPPLGGLTSWHDFLDANQSAPIRHDPDSNHLSRLYSHISSHFKWCLSACGMREMCHVASVHSYKNSTASP